MIIFDKNLYVSLTLQKTSHHFTKIAFIPLHTNLFNIVLLSFFLTIGFSKLHAQDVKKKTNPIPLKTETQKTDNTSKNSDIKPLDTQKEIDSMVLSPNIYIFNNI